MANTYTCADNIVIENESFHALLKKTTIHNNYYKIIKYVVDDVQWNDYYKQRKK